jgi:hypothetical protein
MKEPDTQLPSGLKAVPTADHVPGMKMDVTNSLSLFNVLPLRYDRLMNSGPQVWLR